MTSNQHKIGKFHIELEKYFNRKQSFIFLLQGMRKINSWKNIPSSLSICTAGIFLLLFCYLDQYIYY